MGWLPKPGDKKDGDKDDLHTCDLCDNAQTAPDTSCLLYSEGRDVKKKYHRDKELQIIKSMLYEVLIPVLSPIPSWSSTENSCMKLGKYHSRRHCTN